MEDPFLDGKYFKGYGLFEILSGNHWTVIIVTSR